MTSQWRPPPPLWANVIASLVLAVFLISLPFYLVDQVRFAHDHQTASADVLSAREERSVGSHTPITTWWFTVRFVTAAGQHIEDEVVETSVGSDWNSVQAGDTITVQYDPDNPHDIRLSSGWTDPVVMAMIISILFIIAVAVISGIINFIRDKLNSKTHLS